VHFAVSQRETQYTSIMDESGIEKNSMQNLYVSLIVMPYIMDLYWDAERK
jgi:predicted Ser/Thr protein kinase